MSFFTRLTDGFSALMPFESKAKFSGTQGIVTLSDDKYFPGLVLLARSVALDYPLPIVCFDAGLTQQQIEWVSEHLSNVDIRAIPESALLRAIKARCGESTKPKPGKRIWPLWICSSLIQASPYQRVFWLDVDIVVLRDLRRLFSFLDKGPVFTGRNRFPHKQNDAALYARLPLGHWGFSREPRINAGVSGWDLQRDHDVLKSYVFPAEQAFLVDPTLVSLISTDQGCLMWSIYKHRLHRRVLRDHRWNRCVRGTAAFDFRIPCAPDRITDNHIRELQDKLPETAILHWNGCSTPWTA